MSDIKSVHEAVSTDLSRRRELVAMAKPELIDYIISIENNLTELARRIDAHWDD